MKDHINTIYLPTKFSFQEMTTASEYFSKVSILLQIGSTEAEYKTKATGFIYISKGGYYLVTNWHVVTGKNADNPEESLQLGFVPTIIDIQEKNYPTIELYSASNNPFPIWYEHPKYAQKIDVVVIPLEKCPKNYNPINDNTYLTNHQIELGGEIFILGYPNGISANDTPIWKRGSIASDAHIDNLPKFYIDTATRGGMSGSPVIILKEEAFKNNGIKKVKFIGVYSGRIPKSDIITRLSPIKNDAHAIKSYAEITEQKDLIEERVFMSQLGIVYEATVIDEIIDGKKIGQCQVF